MLTFYEFFCGGGMARLGLGGDWTCLFANDIDPKKAQSYRANFGTAEFCLADVATLKAGDLPGRAGLVWASFPCQDLSLAGLGAGLNGDRSGAFWPFWKLVRGLRAGGRAPKIVVLENVCGLLRSHGGKDFAAIGAALVQGGYKFGAVVLDAADFLPHSRPRLFFVAVENGATIPKRLISRAPMEQLHSQQLQWAYGKLEQNAARNWLWWNMPTPPQRNARFVDFIEDDPPDVNWDPLERTRQLLAMMSPINLAKVQSAQLKRKRVVGGIYRRTRHDEDGSKIQRAEVRFDDVAGCLRTPGGGSSRQRILVVQGNRLRSRLLSAREAARLMGLPESYRLPSNYNDAYHLAGDGVAVPVVGWLEQHLLRPLSEHSVAARKAA